MCLAGGTGLEQVIAAADNAMPQAGLPIASKQAGSEGRRAGLKRAQRGKLLDLLQEILLRSLPALHSCATLQISYPPLQM